jgi:protein subunit release factor B
MISPEKWQKLKSAMHEMKILEKDLTEKFIRSSGKGGQNVNKVSSCVYLHHEPSGLEVKCQKTRSQQDNRYFARKILLEKMAAKETRIQTVESKLRYKLKKQKQKRHKRAKEKILKDKKIQATKKDLRKKIDLQSLRPV